MRTHYVATVPLDDARLGEDLERSLSLRWSEAYSDYIFGGSWNSCMLWAPGGDTGDGVVTNYAYDRPPAFTAYADQLPYLRKLITDTADLDRLNFARLALVTNSVGIPHRDLLELDDLPNQSRNAHRMHIPLATDDNCLFTEGNTVYRMRQGEIWFLDASVIHAVAVLSGIKRIHLMLDFVDTPDPGSLLTVAGGTPDTGIPADRMVSRPALTGPERASLLGLADVLTMDTFNEVFSIVIKKHYRSDGGDDFVWSTLIDLARGSADPAVLPHALKLRRYYTLERSAQELDPFSTVDPAVKEHVS
ncbi:aspartyl beta-hydroxylase [Micromonospora echinospora]|uniref:L-proline 3-hydroxylase, C-terminal n=1 Tax=Micromonospora echinospora TaxID=1877 RepID=A0A1C4YS52_MICEC|nr:aspartyl/asparaginyl beta-hydroxylase domain-containing protein [Micromonospora echinospora]OZV77363.1 aspartyl beta-hydroxylase [Micromonospora echinospora]SCF23490.1 L-proline 3-hydroxylase, C-terminal [Micromonospora echinospora]